MRAERAVEINKAIPTYGWSEEQREALRMATEFLESNWESLDDELDDDEHEIVDTIVRGLNEENK